MNYSRWETQFCEIIAVGDEEGLAILHLNTGEGKRVFEISNQWVRDDDFFSEVRTQIDEYMAGRRDDFSLKLNPQGTDYQKKVWLALTKIPYGELATYKSIAKAIGNEKASRAVGMANSKNPIPIIVPCHRVVGASGKLTGFAHGLKIKEALILHEKLMGIYHRLFDAFGPQGWWPAKTDFEMMIGAILVQNTNWGNVEQALNNLNGELTPQKLEQLSVEELAERIRPSGYYQQKAKKIKAFLAWYAGYDYELECVKQQDGEILRQELLGVHGIGEETADCMLTYAFEKPYFIVDAYARRILERVGFEMPKGYDAYRDKIESAIPKELMIYNELHALLVQLGKKNCKKNPNCQRCPIAKQCSYKVKTFA
jgi:endonuclease-3 related protein